MKPKSTLRSILLAASSSLLAISSASAQSGTWLGNGNAWNDTTAWSGGTIATGSGNTANFTGVNLTSDVSMALGADRTIGNITFTDATTSSHNLTLTDNTLTLAGGTTRTIDVTQTDRNLTISSVLAGTAGFQKTGQGTLTLTGSNSITGATSISGGGKLVLDYSTNDNRKLPNNSSLSLAAGTIVLKGGTATENFTSTTFNTGTNGTFFVRDTGTAKLNLNAFTLGTGSVVSFSHDSMATTDRLNVAGIMGAWFTVGNRWATNSGGVGGAGAADSNIVGYTGGTTFTPAAAVNQDVNYDLAGGGTLTATRFVNTLRIESTGDNQSLILGANSLQTSNLTGTNALSGTSGGLLYAGGANGNYTITDNGSTGRVVIENGNGQAQLINVYTGTLTVNAIIGAGSSAFVKSGEGTLVINKAVGYTGATRVYQGVHRITGAGSLTAGSTVQNGAAIELGNSVAIASTATLTITGTGVASGGALRNVAATTSSYAGAITIGTGGARINSDSGTLTLTGGVVTAGNTVTFGGAGNITVSTAAISGAGGLVKDGAGTTTLSAANSYTGSTNVSDGTLAITGTGSVNTSSGISVAPGATFRYNSSTALTVAPTLSGAGTSNRAVLGGIGTINVAVTLDDLGDVLSPGNSPGIQNYTFGQSWSSFSYDWEVNDFTSTSAGTAFDQIGITGTLDLSGGSGSYFLNVLGLTAGNVAGLTPNFSETDRSWTILTSTNLTGFNAANWTINTTGFTDPNTGTWALAQSGNDLVLSYTAIPEPRAFLLCGIGMLVLLRRRSN